MGFGFWLGWRPTTLIVHTNLCHKPQLPSADILRTDPEPQTPHWSTTGAIKPSIPPRFSLPQSKQQIGRRGRVVGWSWSLGAQREALWPNLSKIPHGSKSNLGCGQYQADGGCGGQHGNVGVDWGVWGWAVGFRCGVGGGGRLIPQDEAWDRGGGTAGGASNPVLHVKANGHMTCRLFCLLAIQQEREREEERFQISLPTSSCVLDVSHRGIWRRSCWHFHTPFSIFIPLTSGIESGPCVRARLLNRDTLDFLYISLSSPLYMFCFPKESFGGCIFAVWVN